MKEYIKKFDSLASADGHVIDNPFVSTIVTQGGSINLTCNQEGKKLKVEGGQIVIVNSVVVKTFRTYVESVDKTYIIQYEEGMTWEEWATCEKYNSARFYPSSDQEYPEDWVIMFVWTPEDESDAPGVSVTLHGCDINPSCVGPGEFFEAIGHHSSRTVSTIDEIEGTWISIEFDDSEILAGRSGQTWREYIETFPYDDERSISYGVDVYDVAGVPVFINDGSDGQITNVETGTAFTDSLGNEQYADDIVYDSYIKTYIKPQ